MLMVIFGAGASYDSIPALKPSSKDNLHPRTRYRPPLADGLFQDRPEFAEILANYPECNAVVPYLRDLRGKSLEQRMEELKAEGERFPERKGQLAAIRYYLHQLLWVCGQHWASESAGITNYASLLDEIRLYKPPDEQVCFLTFNYDLLLEAALKTVGMNIANLNDYITHPAYLVIKVHGSVNWGKRIEGPPLATYQKSPNEAVREIIAHAAELKIVDEYCVVETYPVTNHNYTQLFPAIAIPVQRKDVFECPPEHRQKLEDFLPRVDRLVIVGWRATDPPVLCMIADRLASEVRGLIVAGSQTDGQQVASRLREAGIHGQFSAIEGGFTDAVINRSFKEFIVGYRAAGA